MLFGRWFAVGLIALAAGLSCDRGNPSATKSSETSGGKATTVPAATAPSTQQSPSTLRIDGREYIFPPARLRVSKSNGHILARLYTVDPKSALSEDYKGNGYDLLMKLDDITDPTDISEAVWQYKAANEQFVESPYGIFLEGMHYQLQPADVTARFLGDSLLLRIDLRGSFLQFNQSDANQPGKPVMVDGHVLAPVEYKD